jgi:hypothetical protein
MLASSGLLLQGAGEVKCQWRHCWANSVQKRAILLQKFSGLPRNLADTATQPFPTFPMSKVSDFKQKHDFEVRLVVVCVVGVVGAGRVVSWW